MDIVSLVFFSFLPCLLWLWFCMHKKYVTGILIPFLTAAAAGAVVCSVFARFVFEPFSLALSPGLAPLFTAVILTAIPEESSKLMFLLPFIRTGPERKILPSRSVYARAVFIALAFASFENVIFALRFPGVLPLRFFSAVLLHASASLFSAVWLHERLSGSGRPMHRFTLFGAFFFHSIYAFGLSSSRPWFFLSLLAVAFAGAWAAFLWQTSGESYRD
ncbi:MAG TPA: hypothetical protein GXZ47_07300 [Treponema sp.]|nr:hypothetical protein [Treponema sp.]